MPVLSNWKQYYTSGIIQHATQSSSTIHFQTLYVNILYITSLGDFHGDDPDSLDASELRSTLYGHKLHLEVMAYTVLGQKSVCIDLVSDDRRIKSTTSCSLRTTNLIANRDLFDKSIY